VPFTALAQEAKQLPREPIQMWVRQQGAKEGQNVGRRAIANARREPRQNIEQLLTVEVMSIQRLDQQVRECPCGVRQTLVVVKRQQRMEKALQLPFGKRGHPGHLRPGALTEDLVQRLDQLGTTREQGVEPRSVRSCQWLSTITGRVKARPVGVPGMFVPGDPHAKHAKHVFADAQVAAVTRGRWSL
jgi:hypothetical protein